VKVSAITVSHGHTGELAESLPALASQVDEVLVIANTSESVPPPGLSNSLLQSREAPRVRVLQNERPLNYAANLNKGIAETSGDLLLVANPDAVPEPGAVAILREFVAGRPRCGVAGPQLRNPDGSWQPSRRRFPTVTGTVVRRTPLRRVFPPLERQRAHYHLDERPTEPVEADWMLGGFLLLRREMLAELGGFDAGFPMYGEEIDLCYRAARAGWERWYVPAAVVRHRWDRLTDERLWTRRTLWHWRSIVRFVRKHPERLLAIK
jgi:N-acetylglucosaminyl-diphospho-decaprenol L-rhamnosyltransferase